MNEKEKWLPVIGYEGWYDVSSHGRVRRMKAYRNTFVGRILKEALDGRGYMMVHLSKDGIVRNSTIHRMVTSAFIGPCAEGREVNHIDGHKTNNRIDNLEYVTKSENALHALRLGLQKPVRGEKHGNSKLTEEDVREIRRRLGTELQKDIARRLCVSTTTINSIAMGNNWGWLGDENA